MVGVAKASGAVNEHHAIALQLVLDDSDFIFYDMLYPEIEVRHGYRLIAVGVADAVKIFVVKAGQVKYRFAHGFAGNGAGVDAHPAHRGLAFDNGDALAGFRGLNSGALSPRPRTDHDQVIRQKSPAKFPISAPVISTAILRIRIDAARQTPVKRKTRSPTIVELMVENIRAL